MIEIVVSQLRQELSFEMKRRLALLMLSKCLQVTQTDRSLSFVADYEIGATCYSVLAILFL
jgi:hypothetical protein